MSAISKEDKKYHVILFFLSPVLGLINTIRTKDPKTIRWGLFAFTVIYGSLYHISFGGDGAEHLKSAYDYQYLEFDVFWDELIDILLLQGQNSDPYIHIVSYLISSVLNIPRFFFVPISIVFAYFYSGVIIKLLSYVNFKSPNNKFFVYYFLILFLLMASLADIQYVRSTTGFWVLLYALISYHQTKKKKYILLVFLPVFIHLSYAVLALPIWFILLSGFRYPKLYFIIFMVSMLAADAVDKTSTNEFVSQTEVGAGKVKGYTVDESKPKKYNYKTRKMHESANFYRTYQTNRIQNYVYAAIVIFIFVFLNKKGFSALENSLFSYAMATGSMANFLSFNYAIYNRAWQISGFLIITLLLIFLSKNNLKNIRLSFLKVKLPLFVFAALMFPYILYLLSTLLGFTSPYVFLLPIVNWIEYDFGTSIRIVIGVFM